MQQFVKTSPQLTLTILACLITIYTKAVISNEVNVSDEFNRCERPNCTIVLHGGEHTVKGRIVVEGWEYFELSASEQTTIRCVLNTSEENTVFRIKRSNNVVIENITFVNCSQPNLVFDRYHEYSIISIEGAISVNIANCYFPNYFQVGLKLEDIETVELRNIHFKAGKEHTYKRAIVYETGFSKNVSFTANNLTLDGGNVSYPLKFNHFLLSHHGIGGGLALLMRNNGSVYVQISNSTILNSNAIFGGGIYFHTWKSVKEFNVTVIGCLFENNTAWDSKIGKGGAMVVTMMSGRGNVSIKNCTFQYNKANSGGAIGTLLYDKLGNTYTNIVDSVFRYNLAKMDSGGAIYAENLYISNKNHLYIRNTQFAFNSANSGGAILTMNFFLDLQDNVSIHENKAYYGGGICLLGSWLSLTGKNITLERNNASHSGGALYLHSSSIVKAYGYETIIANNTATVRGGGIFVFTKYFENQRRDDKSGWRDRGELYSFNCFLQAKPEIENALILSNNKATSGVNLCMGDDLFTNTWGPCFNKTEKNPISRSIVFKDKAVNKCSIALDIVSYNTPTNLTSPCRLEAGTGLSDCRKNFELKNLPHYHQRLNEAIRSQGVELERSKNVHLFFPGYESRIDIQSLDGTRTPIQTMTQIIFKPHNPNLLESKVPYYVLAISTSAKKNFTIKKISHDFIFGKICLQSYSTLNEVSYCEDAIIGDCPSPLLTAEIGQSCEFISIPKFDGHDIKIVERTGHSMRNKYSIQLNPGTLFTYPSNKSKDFVFMHCTWFQCKCHLSASMSDCVFNVNAPEKQCRKELKFPYCTKCEDEIKRICPPFNWFCIVDKNCFNCHQPYIMIAIYFVLTLGITVVICLLHLDVFSDYIRSLVFYSSTLYVFSINCGTFERRVIYKALSVPINVLNLLVTHMFPFCLPTNEPIYLAIFNMVAPFVFVAYIAIIIILVNKAPYISRLGRFDVVNKLWTIIILTYVHLCNQAFSVLNCPINSLNERTWMYDGNLRCLVGLHLVGSIIAILLLFGLVTFPIVMLIFSRSQNPNYQSFVKVYEERYKVEYKYWELVKLYLRVLFPFMVTLLPQAIKVPRLPCSTLSIFCFLLMILNSLLKPARNNWANSYESLCFLILAYMGIQNESYHLGKTTVSVVVIVPYLIYGVYIIVKIAIWLYGYIKDKL